MPEYKQYIRCHIVKATPMTRGACYELLGRTMMANDESPSDEGYHVIYSDDYESWCPKAQFEAAGSPIDSMTFGLAIDACRYKGKKIQRANWNGKGQYVEFRHVATLLEDECDAIIEEGNERDCFAYVFHFVNSKTGETGIQVGWLASQADMAASDWVIVE